MSKGLIVVHLAIATLVLLVASIQTCNGFVSGGGSYSILSPSSIDTTLSTKGTVLHDSSSSSPKDSKAGRSRRDALSGLFWTCFSSLGAPGVSTASDGMTEYKPSKRATAYFVDSTVPPTLVPYRKQREAAILKSLGNGYGTLKKTSLLDTTITLNNIMNKTISAAFDKLNTKNQGGPYDSSFVFLGIDLASNDDVQLAVNIMESIIQPRKRKLATNTAAGVSWAPRSTQTALDTFLRSEDSSTSSTNDLKAALLEAKVPLDIVSSQLPLLQWAKKQKLPLIALSPEISDLDTVRTKGLQDLDMGRRAQYVVDTQGFIDMVQNPKFQLYTDKSMMKDYTSNDDISPGDFFAERILYDEAVATAASNWALLTNSRNNNKNSLMIVLSAIEGVRFFGGANGRIRRVSSFLSPDSAPVEEEAITTILLNPTAQKTLSQSNYLRTVIGTTPESRPYQTKIADYLWFTSMPKVNMLPRMMNIR